MGETPDRPRVQPKPFAEALVDEAGALLAERHRRDRGREDLLPARFEQPGPAGAAVLAAWRRPGARGSALFDRGRMVAYLIGDSSIDTLQGRTVWIRPSGQALGASVSAELLRDLYAAVAVAWVDEGCFIHRVMVPAADEGVLAAWFSLGFGLEQAYAVCRLSGRRSLAAPGEARPGLSIRRATPEDAPTLVELSDLIARHQARAPVWAPAPPEFVAALREGYAEALSEDGVVFWLAFADRKLVGFQGYFPAGPDPDDLFTPDDCVALSVAATREQARGRGIGRALTARGLVWAAEEGYRHCLVDWRTTNLLSSRFFPARGFQPVYYRLCRMIDHRVAWAR